MAEDRMLNDEILLGLIKSNSGGGGGGTTNYNLLSNKPQIAGTELQGDKSLADLGIASASALATKQNATDNSLETEDKTIVGAINEHEGDVATLKSGLTNLSEEVNGDAIVYPYADVITIEDAVPANLADCSVKVEPVQDLHGYDKPWVGGAGKNKLPLTVDGIKAANTDGTWSGNTYTLNNVTFDLQTDDGENITGIKVNGTANAVTIFYATGYGKFLTVGTNYTLNGCTSGAGDTYKLDLATSTGAITTSTTGDGDNTPFTVANSVDYRARIVVYSGVNVSNQMFYPMIRLSTETDSTFAPYSNICPISGHTESVVYQFGRNIANPSDIIDGFYENEEWSIGFSGSTVYRGLKLWLKRGTYVVSFGKAVNIIRAIYDGVTYQNVAVNVTEYSFTVTENGDAGISWRDATSGSTDWDDSTPVQLEVGSYATPYEPYLGQQYTLALGDTIYGGTVDFDSGVMTVTHGYADLGNFTYTKQTSENGTVFYTGFNAVNNAKYGNIDYVGTSLCSCFEYASAKTVSSYNKETINVGYDTSTRLRVCTDAFATLSESDFKTAVTGQKLCYELATPFTVQLTPQQIQLLQGQNTIYASTGQISVTVNGVSGAIGAVQEQVNGLAGKIGENQIYSDTPVQIGTVGDKPLYRLFVTFETPISSVDNEYTSTGINSEDIELILRGDGINADGTYYGHLAFDPTFNDHQAIGVKGVANIKYAVIEYI